MISLGAWTLGQVLGLGYNMKENVVHFLNRDRNICLYSYPSKKEVISDKVLATYLKI